jgi:hypothetical protein
MNVVGARATSIASILIDASQISEAALGNCSAALVETIMDYPSLAGQQPSTASLCVNALSSVLATQLPPALLANVSLALASLTAGIQATMAVGQALSSITTANLRVGTGLLDPATASSQTLSPPQTAAEMFENVPSSSLAINASSIASGSSLGVSVLQHTNNPHNVTTSATPMTLQTIDYGQTGSVPGFTITLVNTKPVHYYSGTELVIAVTCSPGPEPYNVTVMCGENPELVECPGSVPSVSNIHASSGTTGMTLTSHLHAL